MNEYFKATWCYKEQVEVGLIDYFMIIKSNHNHYWIIIIFNILLIINL